MIKILGKILWERFPKLYKRITKAIFLLKRRDSIYISDYFGESFKTYISKYEMEQKLENLKFGLDEYSKKTVDVVYERILNYPEYKYKQALKPKKGNIIGGLLNEEQISFNPKNIKKETGIKLNTNQMESSVFEFFHGIVYFPIYIQKLIENKDFIDVGAFIGDSALALRRYNYKKIYSIEMSQQSIMAYKKNMSANGLGAQYYEIINCALTSKEGLSPIIIKDSGSAGLTLNNEKAIRAKQISIEQKTLNSIVKEYGIKPAFIKMDVEGMGMDCLLGGLEIIKEFRPALSVAIYHNPIEFFEIKPFLQQELPNYSFMIRKLSNLITNNSCHAETILLAYPNQ